jgi:hypothetical protein
MKSFLLSLLIGACLLVVPEWAWAQTDSSNPQQIVCGSQGLEFYQVDYTENGGTGTAGSTYVWSVNTPLAVITNNLGPAGSSNRISIDWSAVPIGPYTVTVVEENGNGCAADPIVLNVEIIQPEQPIVECWETATFDNATCQWIVTGTQPEQPVIECWETATFNDATCQWDVTGTQPVQPTIECWETATFNNTTCQWDVTGTQPVQPTIECWETATFNNTTCQWDVTGTQPVQPTIECWETATFDNTLCDWVIVGTPFSVNVTAGPPTCYEGIAVFDFTGGPANGIVTFTVDGVQETLVLDATGSGTYLLDPATADVVVNLISISNGTCVINVNGTATVDVSPQIITSPISHD